MRRYDKNIYGYKLGSSNWDIFCFRQDCEKKSLFQIYQISFDNERGNLWLILGKLEIISKGHFCVCKNTTNISKLISRQNYYQWIMRILNSVSMINERDKIILLYTFLLISLWINITLVTDIIVRAFLSY